MTRSRAIGFSGVLMLSMLAMAACTQDRMNNIPANATLGSSGNDRLSYTATSDGTVWVYDKNHDQIDYSGPLVTNQVIVVDPSAKTITIDGRVVADKKVNGLGTKHEIYFVPGNTAGMRS